MPTNRQLRHERFQGRIAETLKVCGFEVYSLATRERADLFAVDHETGGVVLIEVKSSRKGHVRLSKDERECCRTTVLPYLRARPGKTRGTVRLDAMNEEAKATLKGLPTKRDIEFAAATGTTTRGTA